MFKHILNFVRNNSRLTLPDNFCEFELLKLEAEFFGCFEMVRLLQQRQADTQLALRTTNALGLMSTAANGSGRNTVRGTGRPGYITVGYRGSFAFGRDGLADVKFRKLTKILVSGKVALCREVFGDTLNESRDPDHNDDDNRYTARFFLKHLQLEQAFDCLQEAGFKARCASGSGTASVPGNEPVKPGIDTEETRWNHYNEFVFSRP